jgi:hypothetical protein
MKIAIAILLSGCFLMMFFAYSQSTKLQQQRNEISELRTKLDAMPKNATLDFQEKCAKQARAAFTQDGWDKKPMATFADHYNVTLNKCFVEIEDADMKSAPGRIWRTKLLMDAFEGKVYGNYLWSSEKGKRYWEVAPVECTVSMNSGEDKSCSSENEFDLQVRQYME